MSENKTTNVVGYFNGNPHPVAIEISEANAKIKLDPNAYIRDGAGLYINDPIFENYVYKGGLSRATGKRECPIRFMPRLVQAARTPSSVTQATSFVREPSGRVVPTFAPQTSQPAREVPKNKNPITGITVEKARKIGLIGRPRLVSEDYGIEDTPGAPQQGRALPGIKYSVESPPKIKTAAPLTPELMEADQDLGPEEQARRSQLQQGMARAAAASPAESFDPARVRPLPARAPVPLKAPNEPTSITAGHLPVKLTPRTTAAKKGFRAIAQQLLPKKRVAVVVEEQPEPIPAETEPAQEAAKSEEMQQETLEESGSGVIEPIDGTAMPEPSLETPQAEQPGKRFLCAADGKSFAFRSELERHVRRKYAPDIADQLLAGYPAEQAPE